MYAPKFNSWRIALLVLKHEGAKLVLRLSCFVAALVAALLIAKAFA